MNQSLQHVRTNGQSKGFLTPGRRYLSLSAILRFALSAFFSAKSLSRWILQNKNFNYSNAEVHFVWTYMYVCVSFRIRIDNTEVLLMAHCNIFQYRRVHQVRLKSLWLLKHDLGHFDISCFHLCIFFSFHNPNTFFFKWILLSKLNRQIYLQMDLKRVLWLQKTYNRSSGSLQGMVKSAPFYLRVQLRQRFSRIPRGPQAVSWGS